MKKMFGYLSFAIAIVLLSFATRGYVSPMSELTRAVVGVPTDTTVWLAIGSILAVITGIYILTDKESKGRGNFPGTSV